MNKKNQHQAVQMPTQTQIDQVVEQEQNDPPPTIEDLTVNVAAAVESQNSKPKLRIVKDLPAALEALVENGIRIRKAVFHRTVLFDYQGGSPEYAFYSPDWSKDMKKTKVAEMWYTPHGLVCSQAGLWKIVPLANVSDTII